MCRRKQMKVPIAELLSAFLYFISADCSSHRGIYAGKRICHCGNWGYNRIPEMTVFPDISAAGWILSAE